jgi:hypothetical protein
LEITVAVLLPFEDRHGGAPRNRGFPGIEATPNVEVTYLHFPCVFHEFSMDTHVNLVYFPLLMLPKVRPRSSKAPTTPSSLSILGDHQKMVEILLGGGVEVING